eukprot:NODE_263_length_11363_cov_0.749556.p2 type:complete len:570 gc:universal NODE_263_length_11363_cov_0.749556:7617-9326(+)
MDEINNNCCIAPVTGVACSGGIISSISWTDIYFNGTFPTSQPIFPPQLTYFNVEFNALTGELPKTGYPSTLKFFSVTHNNHMNGTIPRFPDGLETLAAGDNSFSNFATLPTNLTYLDISQNFVLYKEFPSHWPPNLLALGVQNNNMNGTVTNLPDGLLMLTLRGNKITGTIPKLPSKLVDFTICSNQITNITYPLPDTITNINMYSNIIKAPLILPPLIQSYYANSNLLYGPIPSVLPPTLGAFVVGINQLTGDISNLTYYHVQPNFNSPLTDLEMQHNFLTGHMPKLPALLKVLKLHYNQLSGPAVPIPDTVTWLQIGNQPLTGTIHMKQPVMLEIDNTLIHDVIVDDASQLTINYCKVSGTPTLNNTNVESFFQICERTDLFLYIPPVYNTTDIGYTSTIDSSTIDSSMATSDAIMFTKSATLQNSQSFAISATISEENQEVLASIITRRIKFAISTALLSINTTQYASTLQISTTTTKLSQTTMAHFQYQPEPLQFNISISSIIRIAISIMILVNIFRDTPWKHSKTVKMNRFSTTKSVKTWGISTNSSVKQSMMTSMGTSVKTGF